MSIPFSLSRMRNPRRPNDPQKLYAHAQAWKVISQDQIAEEAAWGTTLTRGDMKNVFYALGQRVAHHLNNGNMVDLEGLGRLHTELRSEGADTPEEFTARNITEVKFKFRPGKLLRVALRDLTFERVLSRKAIKEAKQNELKNL